MFMRSMSDNVETDWIANCTRAWGVGYSKEQALEELATNFEGKTSDTYHVELVEHVGDARISPTGVTADEVVSEESVEVSGGELVTLMQSAISARSKSERILEG